MGYNEQFVYRIIHFDLFFVPIGIHLNIFSIKSKIYNLLHTMYE